MRFYLQYLKDTLGNNYLGIDIPKESTFVYLEQLKDYLGETEFEEYQRRQQERDRGHNHITVVNVMECNKIISEKGMDWFAQQADNLFKTGIDDVRFLGVGVAERNENTDYFIVVNSQSLNDIREGFGLPNHDFHVTIGFKWKDVFGVRKNEVMDFKDPFLEKIAREYLKSRETFEFVKNIENYFGEEDDEIECVSIRETSVSFRIEDTNKYFTVSYLNPQGFYITSIWEDDDDKPCMSSHLIVKKLLNRKNQ
ncbi:hypothetical protein EBU94_09100 [bacterium]|nr:hypothetical protein [bacterium]